MCEHARIVKTVVIQKWVGVMRHTMRVTECIPSSATMPCAAFYDEHAPERHFGRPVTRCHCGEFRVIWGDERD